MTLDEIRQGGWAWLRQRCEGVEFDNQRRAYEYISMLAFRSTTDISQWDVVEVFKDPNGKEIPASTVDNITYHTILTDPREINMRFFQHTEQLSLESITLTDDQKRGLIALSRNLIGYDPELYRDRLRNALAAYDEAYHYVENNLKTLRKINQEIAGATLTVIDLPAQVERLLSQGFWKLWGVTPSTISLVTTNPVILEYNNEKKNLGFMRFDYEVSECLLKGRTHKNNIVIKNCIHPNVKSNGNVCFGEQQVVADQCKYTGNIEGLFTHLMNLLAYYNPSQHPFLHPLNWMKYVEPMDPDAYDEDGYDDDGYDPAGFDREGFDRDGFDAEGFNAEGYTREEVEQMERESAVEDEPETDDEPEDDGFEAIAYSMAEQVDRDLHPRQPITFDPEPPVTFDEIGRSIVRRRAASVRPTLGNEDF